MKRIALSVFTILTVVAVTTGGTLAVFSDTDSFVGNTISTAQVNISANPETGNNPTRLPKPVSALGLIPGQVTDFYRGVIFNQANSTNVRLFMEIDITNNQNGVCDETQLTVWTGHAANGADSERSIELMDDTVSNLAAASRVEITGPGKVFNPTIAPNTSAVLQQQVELLSTATQQNSTCTWDEVFTAETP